MMDFIYFSNLDRVFVFEISKDSINLLATRSIKGKVLSLEDSNNLNDASLNKLFYSEAVSLLSQLNLKDFSLRSAEEILDYSLINEILFRVSKFYNSEFNKVFLFQKEILELLESEKLKAVDEDKLIIQYEETVDQLTKVWNILSKRIREFLFLKSPELAVIGDDETLIEELNSLSVYEVLKKHNLNSDLTIDLSEVDEKELKELVSLCFQIRKKLEDTRNRMMHKVKTLMPKTSVVATPLIAAKLLALAGSFEKLAMMPSSRIQLLGAEKALFRYLKKGGKLPKYGVLFQHSDVVSADKKHRGKVARKLASKISIALKQDYFGGSRG